jgi:hypothetical protein
MWVCTASFGAGRRPRVAGGGGLWRFACGSASALELRDSLVGGISDPENARYRTGLISDWQEIGGVVEV